MNNLGHWLGLQTLARGVPVCADTLPLSDIVLTASRRGPQDLQLAVPFVAQIFMAASSSVAFQPSLPCFRELLSLLARLHMYPHVGLRCSLEIEILFNHLSLQLSDFQSSSEHCQHDTTFSVHGMCEDKCREREESVWSSMKREASLQSAPNHVLSSSTAQQPNYNVSSSMGWGQSMGMQNPGMGMQTPGVGMQNPGMGYGMMPMYPMYGQYGIQPGMLGTGYGMHPGLQFQRPQ